MRVSERPPEPMSLRGHLLSGLGLLSLALFVYGPALLSGQVQFSPHSDLLPQHLATKQVLWDALQAGRLPLWRSDQLMGAPALTDPQALYLHPLQALFWLVEPLRAYGPTVFLELWLAALGAHALSRYARRLAGGGLLRRCGPTAVLQVDRDRVCGLV